MEYAFSDRIKNMTGNAIRDIFKLLARPEVISFAGGMPAADALPAEQIREIASQVLKDDPTGILQYGATEAYAPLRQSAAHCGCTRCDFEVRISTWSPLCNLWLNGTNL